MPATMQWVEIPKRSMFRHPIKVDRANVSLVWNFSTMKRDIGFGVSLRLVADSDTKGFKEILPIKRYDSQKVTVKGSILIEEPGTYVLVFDNSYSKLTSKRLTFYVDVKNKEEKEAEPDLAGYLLKKKKQKGVTKAWVKRWFQLTEGILTYYKTPGSYCRGTIDLASATISVVVRTRQISIDNGQMLFHMKALAQEELNRWIEALRKYQQIQFSKILDSVDDSHTEAMDELEAKIEKIQGDLTRAKMLLTNRKSSNDLRHIAGSIKRKAGIKAGASLTGDVGLDDRDMNSLVMEIIDDVQSCFNDLVADHHKNKNALEMEIERRRVLELELREIREQTSATTATSTSTSSSVPTTISDKFPAMKHRRVGSASTYSSKDDKFFDAAEILVDGSEVASSDDEAQEAELEGDVEDDEQSDESDEEDNKPGKAEDVHDEIKEIVTRRTRLPANAPTADINLFAIMRKNVGKELSKVSMPVSLNEPLNMLQRLCEELEYSELLDKAAAQSDSIERMMYVAAFAVSGYASTFLRPARKPFNPLLGETYECVRADRGFKFISEKVQHHPVVIACHCDSPNFTFYQQQKPKSKFWGKSMELNNEGLVHVELPKHGDHYTWSKVTTCMRNLFSESRYLEHYGELVISNLTTGEKCVLSFKESGYFSSTKNEVTGVVKDKNGHDVRSLSGKWNEAIQVEVDKEKFRYLWRAHAPLPNAAEQYGFTQFAIELNELTDELRPLLPSTDTRFRPDQRLLEEGRCDQAEAEKTRVEEKQRLARKDAENSGIIPEPKWFEERDGEYRYRGGYWEARDARSFKNIPTIF